MAPSDLGKPWHPACTDLMRRGGQLKSEGLLLAPLPDFQSGEFLRSLGKPDFPFPDFLIVGHFCLTPR